MQKPLVTTLGMNQADTIEGLAISKVKVFPLVHCSYSFGNHSSSLAPLKGVTVLSKEGVLLGS